LGLRPARRISSIEKVFGVKKNVMCDVCGCEFEEGELEDGQCERCLAEHHISG